MLQYRRCPRCDAEIFEVGRGALSRAARGEGAEVEVCSRCGSREAQREADTGGVLALSAWPVSLEALLEEERMLITFHRKGDMRAMPLASEDAKDMVRGDWESVREAQRVATQPPERLKLEIRDIDGFNGVGFEDGHLLYHPKDASDEGTALRSDGWLEVETTPETWRRFWRTLDDLGVWDWAERYEPPDGIRHGTVWQIGIERGERRIVSSGSNAYPGASGHDRTPEFERFCRAVSRLVGGRTFR
jgi:hypothetical protein